MAYNEPILFFDGYCNLCNRSVDFIIRMDHKKRLRYASLQGETAKKMIPEEFKDVDSLILFMNEKFYSRSSAALLAISKTGGWRKILLIFWIVPKFIRDAVYKWIAKNRYRWFGKSETCRMPTAEEKSLFLD